MKKLFFAVALFISLNAMAQTEAGSSLVGGSFSVKTGKNSSQIAFNPTYGYFFADNFAVGANVGLNYAKLGEVKNTEFGIGPFARYYIGVANTRPFLTTEVNFLNQTSKTAVSTIKNSGTSFMFGLGFAAFINETVAVEGLTGYSYSKYKNVEGNSGFNLRLGFGLYFNRNTMNSLRTNVMGN